MILDTSSITLTVLININTFLINTNIKNSGNTSKNKRKDYNLAERQQKNTRKV